MKNPLWEGVYHNFQDVPVTGPGFSGHDWIENSSEKLSNFKSLASNSSTVPSVIGYTDSLLPVIAGIVQGNKKKVKILDFDGGLGFSFYHVREALGETKNFELYVVDIEEVCTAGEKLFHDEPQIEFHSDVTDILHERFDIVHIGSSLQYIEQRQDQLSVLCQFNPEYILMANIPAGDIRKFATAQNYYGSTIGCWFFNVEELSSTMLQNNYGLIFKSSYFTKLYGVEQPYPLENFKEEYRVKYPCMLLFQKQS